MKKQILLLLFGFLAITAFAQKDADACDDHPLITRFSDAHIIWCSEKNLTEYQSPTSMLLQNT